MGQVNLLKLVTVVEDDINPEDPQQVEWSLAARFRGHEDMIVIPGVKADRCDPVNEHLTVTKSVWSLPLAPVTATLEAVLEFVRAPLTIYERVRRELDKY